jgi:hypothetical protein
MKKLSFEKFKGNKIINTSKIIGGDNTYESTTMDGEKGGDTIVTTADGTRFMEYMGDDGNCWVATETSPGVFNCPHP